MAVVHVWGEEHDPEHTSIHFTGNDGKIIYLSYEFSNNNVIYYSFDGDKKRFFSNIHSFEINYVDTSIYKLYSEEKESWKELIGIDDDKLKKYINEMFSCTAFIANALLVSYKERGEKAFVYFEELKHRYQFYTGSPSEFIKSFISYGFKGKFLRDILKNDSYSDKEKFFRSLQTLFVPIREQVTGIRLVNIIKIIKFCKKAKEEGIRADKLLVSFEKEIGADKISEDLISDYFDDLHKALWTPKEVFFLARKIQDRDNKNHKKQIEEGYHSFKKQKYSIYINICRTVGLSSLVAIVYPAVTYLQKTKGIIFYGDLLGYLIYVFLILLINFVISDVNIGNKNKIRGIFTKAINFIRSSMKNWYQVSLGISAILITYLEIVNNALGFDLLNEKYLFLIVYHGIIYLVIALFPSFFLAIVFTVIIGILGILTMLILGLIKNIVIR